MSRIKLGVIADDFTGASDAASFLVKSGNKVILLTDIPTSMDYDCDCIVVGLKIRNVESNEAIRQVSKVMDLFEKINVEKYYYKYCSTFDSTPKGNIGPVMDYLLDRIGISFSILCPSLPVNGRTVKDGVLYVNGVPLAESSLKNHPLNPMWDSYIPNLMKSQSKYPVYLYRTDKQYKEINNKYYLVPDYIDECDGEKIAQIFGYLKLLSGGSGLLEHLIKGNNIDDMNMLNSNISKSIIVCGSCSEMTNKQVEQFKKTDNAYISIDSKKLLDGTIGAEKVFKIVKGNLPKVTLIYSDGCEGNLNKNSDTFLLQSKAMENFLSDIAFLAKENGFSKIIVAGGETSGAVTMKLGFDAFYVGQSVAPGVPWLIPISQPNVLMLLKSGNFGDEYFFERAIKEF